MYKVDQSKCTGCGLCVNDCPTEAVKVENDKAQINEDECIECGACQAACVNGAIEEE